MRKKLFMLFVVFFCVFSIHAGAVFASDDVVMNDETGIPDKGLYQWILETLEKKENETFTKQEASAIEWLDTRGFRPIKSLKGIGCLSNMVQLDLRGHGLINLDGIEELTKLKSLDLEGSRVKSLEPISKLITLESLYIDNINLKSLKGIEGLKNLKSLSASKNKLKNIKEIKALVNLEVLYLDENKLTNIKAVSRLKKLRILNVRSNGLKKASGLKDLAELEQLDLSDNKLIDVQEIKYLKNLLQLSLSDNHLKKLPDLKNLKKLSSISVDRNYFTEKELKSKIPNKFWKNKNWRADVVNLQKLNSDITFISPSSAKKITKNTTKITGSISRLPGYTKDIYVQLYNPASSLYREKRWKVGADGKFEINGINLKKWAGQAVSLNVLVYSQKSKDWAIANSIKFTVKK